MKLLTAASAILTLMVFGPNQADATASVCDAIAGNLVTNCGFEGGTFNVAHENEPDGWTFTPSTTAGSAAGVPIFGPFNPHSGTQYYEFGSTGMDDEISQLINVTVGHKYQIEFWLSPDGGNPSDFTAMFGNTTLVSLTNPAAVTDSANNNYELFTFDETDTSATQEAIAFFGADQGGNVISLDDVSVVDLSVVPEPASLAIFAAGLVGVGWLRRRRSIR